MKAVLQRALHASVSVDGQIVGRLERPGVVALVGVHRSDTEADAQKLARRIATLRMLEDEESVVDAGAPVLVISQFTLQARTRKGTRPSWSDAASGAEAEPLVGEVVRALKELGVETQTGVFGAFMNVELVNNGPYTLILDTRETRSTGSLPQ